MARGTVAQPLAILKKWRHYMLSDKRPPMRVIVRPEHSDHIPAFYNNNPIPDGPVLDCLKSDLPLWQPKNPVMLDLPPGTGKTTFVYDVLLEEALNRGMNLLLVSNRVALSSQQKFAIMERTHDPRKKLLTDEGVRQTEDFGPVRVITYHRLSALLHDKTSIPWITNLAYVVFDEAHFFAADALFNPNTDYYLRLACQRFSNSVRVYMTGTSWDILEPLADAELKYYRHPRTFVPQYVPPREFIRYTRSPDFSSYTLHFFRELSDLTPKILGNSREKWLVFTDSKERGKAFETSLGDKCLYLDADSKSTAEWNTIISAKRFEQQVLVTTSALDNGINIIDSGVKNIAIVADNRTSLIQMMGRKRLGKGEKVNLWVCDLPKRTIAARFQQCDSWLDWYARLDRCVLPDHYLKFGRDIWDERDISLHNLFRPWKGRFYPNNLARHVIVRRYLFFKSILNGHTTFRREVATWLGFNPDDTSGKERLYNFYRNWGDQPLPESLKIELRELVALCYQEAGLNDPHPDRVPAHSNRILTKHLHEAGLPYTVEAEKGVWRLVRTSED